MFSLSELSGPILIYFVGYLVVLLIYRLKNLHIKFFIFYGVLAASAHLLGSIVYATAHIGPDSEGYFNAPKDYFISFGTNFTRLISYYVQKYITGHNYIAELSFFGSIAYVGQMLLPILFMQCQNHIKKSLDISLKTKEIYLLILIFWPSFLIHPTGIGKDSMCFFSSILWMFGLFNYFSKNKRLGLTLLLTASILSYGFRPYFVMVLWTGFFLSLVLQQRISYSRRLFAIIIALTAILALSHFFGETYVKEQDQGLLDRAIFQQSHQAIGTHIPMPTHNPLLLPLFLPYLALGNLFLPLFFLTSFGIVGILASLENLFFLLICLNAFRPLKFSMFFLKKINFFGALIVYPLLGMTLMSLVNTNLGLAMRQKTMYTPAILIAALLLISIKQSIRKGKA